MCNFFSIVTDPENCAGKRFYFDWEWRKAHIDAENDSHSTICKHFGLAEDVCNKFEYNPLTKEFVVDQINSPTNDRAQVEEWFSNLDYKRIVEPLIIKSITRPFDLLEVTVTDEHIQLLKDWASVGDSVWASVRASVRNSVSASVWAYTSSFFSLAYKYDFTPCVKLWEAGLVPSFDGVIWRLHSGKNAHIVYSMRVGNK